MQFHRFVALSLSTCIFMALPVFAQVTPESNAAAYFNIIKHNPQALKTFLHAMPKGGDLHNHEDGATYAEALLSYAKDDGLCVNRTTYVASMDANCDPQDLLYTAVQDKQFKNNLIDAWSMRHFAKNKTETGHDHFFATFAKFGKVSHLHRAEILSEITSRAAAQNEWYLELMTTADGDASGKLGSQLGWNDDFDVMRNQLFANDFNAIVKMISDNLNQDEAKYRVLSACDTNHPKKGCEVTVRYLYQVLREQAPESVFAQLLAGFEAASHDSRMVGINMVQPEDGPISMRDYKLHMQMVQYFRKLYPNVHVSLHAGELNKSLVSPDGLTFHIHDAVDVAGADRIGHGVDIVNETDYEQLLKEMAQKQTLVEINLSSNAMILNISDANHPLPLYLQYDVPVTLSTDDEGVSRSDLTNEYVKAVQDFQFDYETLKTFSRNSLQYSFLAGSSLWVDHHYQQTNAACAQDALGTIHPSDTCAAFLKANEKAAQQWKLEGKFAEFEARF